MNGKRRAIAVVAAALIAWAGSALGQTKPACEQGKVVTPVKVAGQVVKVDMAKGMLSVREADGKIHEFQAGSETLKDFKPGDRIEATLREAPKCP
jgi:hypothetical protein